MGKLYRYGANYPSPYTKWMYPPEGMSATKYLSIYMKSFWQGKRPEVRTVWWFWAGAALMSLWSVKMSLVTVRDPNHFANKFWVNLKHDKPHWLLGPPDPKMVATRKEHKILHATHK